MQSGDKADRHAGSVMGDAVPDYGGTPFVGREPELAKLKAALGKAGEGTGRTVFIAGEPGVGKTRLAGEFAGYARSIGWQVLTGRGYEMLSMPPYVALSEALGDYVHNCPIERMRRELGQNAAEVAVLVREVRSRLPRLGASAPLSPELERYRLFEGVSQFLVSIARGTPPGLVVILDDLHWADQSTVLLLRYIAQKLIAFSFVLVGIYRPTEVDNSHPLSDLLAELSRERLADNLELSALSSQELATLIQKMTGTAPAQSVADAICRETGGNPFFVEEMVRHLVAEGRNLSESGEVAKAWKIPNGVKQVIVQRLSRLGPEVNRILETAAVLGDGFTVDLLAAISGIDAGRINDSLDLAVQRGMIREGGSGYQFAHPLFRRTIYDGLSLHRRQRMHLESARVLEATHARYLSPYVPMLASHYRLAGPAADPEKATDYAVRAAEAARSVLAFDEAATRYQDAIDLLENERPLDVEEQTRYCRLLLSLGDAQALMGDPVAARETYARAAEVARRESSAEHLACAALGFAGRLWGFMAPPGSADLLEEALARFGDNYDNYEELRVNVICRLAEVLWTMGQDERGRRLADKALALARRNGTKAAMARTVPTHSWVSRWPESAKKILSVCDEALCAAGEERDWEFAIRLRLVRAIALLSLGRVALTAAQVKDMQGLYARAQIPVMEWDSLCMRAVLADMQGKFAESESVALQCREAARRLRTQADEAYYVTLAASCRMEETREDEVEYYLEDLRRRMPPLPIFRASLVAFCVRLGRHEKLRRQYDALAASDFADVREGGLDEAYVLVAASEACAILGDTRRAPILYRKMAPMAMFNLVPAPACCFGSGARYLGLLAATMRHWDRAFEHFEAALEMNRRLGAKPWIVLTQRDYARALLIHGAPGERRKAAGLLEEAQIGAAALGTGIVEKECVDLLAAAKGKTSRVAYPDGLTGREVEVLCRLAAGESDSLIAGTLGVSTHTVKRHIANIYAKTGLHNRAQATRYAVDKRLVSSTGQRPT